MRKLLILPLLLLLVACGSADEPQDTAPSEGAVANEASAPAETSGDDTSVEETSSGDTAQDGKGSVVTGKTPEQAGVVREQDHVKGAAEPTVTIIEYGDFQ